MKKYWFYGYLPKDTITEDKLSQNQKEIINIENNKLNSENLFDWWIGFEVENGWEFMRHGFEVIFINEAKGNVARHMHISKLKETYSQILQT